MSSRRRQSRRLGRPDAAQPRPAEPARVREGAAGAPAVETPGGDPQQRSAIIALDGVPDARPDDVASPEAAVAAVYDVISGPAEEERQRDWSRFRALFLPGARFLLTRWGDRRAVANEDAVRQWDVDGFVATASMFYRQTGFWEREVWHRTERFGNVAHVFSTYESRVGSPESDPVGRGINSFQLVRSAGRWWIASIAWDVEVEGNAIPAEYD